MSDCLCPSYREPDQDCPLHGVGGLFGPWADTTWTAADDLRLATYRLGLKVGGDPIILD